MHPSHQVALQFQPHLDDLEAHKELRDGLSAVLQVGPTLWVANDESSSVERLAIAPDGRAAAGHTQFLLQDYLDLPLPPEGKPPRAPEVDVEGLDHDGGYLWLVGSHSLKRKKPSLDEGDVKSAHKQLAKLSADGNRYLLARIPLVEEGAEATLCRRHRHAGAELTAARLRGDDSGNQLLAALREDKHLAAFVDIPGKDNGLDVEGLVVCGKRVFLGLRGPVLRGWAAILELHVADDAPGLLRLEPMDKKGRLFRKHFLHLGGRGVRDIHLDGQDLLILAGPTMDLDGTISLLRWRDALKAEGPSMVPASALEPLLDLPNGADCDKAEGVSFFTPPGGDGKRSLLVVHDAASAQRQVGDSTLLADVYDWP